MMQLGNALNVISKYGNLFLKKNSLECSADNAWVGNQDLFPSVGKHVYVESTHVAFVRAVNEANRTVDVELVQSQDRVAPSDALKSRMSRSRARSVGSCLTYSNGIVPVS